MSKTGISLFSAHTAHFRTEVRKAATYTVLATDERVQMNATFTATLPVISTFVGSTNSKKVYSFENVSTAANNFIATVAAGTGNTIGGRASIELRVGEKLVIDCTETETDWAIIWPNPIPAGIRNLITLTATTSGTAVQNLVDASGSAVVGVIVGIQTDAQDTFAGDIVVKNTNGTVATIAKSTTAGLSVSAVALTTPTLALGDLLTVESSTTNGNARVFVTVSTQQLTAIGSVTI